LDALIESDKIGGRTLPAVPAKTFAREDQMADKNDWVSVWFRQRLEERTDSDCELTTAPPRSSCTQTLGEEPAEAKAMMLMTTFIVDMMCWRRIFQINEMLRATANIF
jgi:hypothetical protein